MVPGARLILEATPKSLKELKDRAGVVPYLHHLFGRCKEQDDSMAVPQPPGKGQLGNIDFRRVVLHDPVDVLLFKNHSQLELLRSGL